MVEVVFANNTEFRHFGRNPIITFLLAPWKLVFLLLVGAQSAPPLSAAGDFFRNKCSLFQFLTKKHCFG
jgi:hypothetical protein